MENKSILHWYEPKIKSSKKKKKSKNKSPVKNLHFTKKKKRFQIEFLNFRFKIRIEINAPTFCKKCVVFVYIYRYKLIVKMIKLVTKF